jgi:hypothetical protein
MSVDWSNIKDWDRESRRLEVANASGVELDDVHFPGDNDPELNIILRFSQEALLSDAESHAMLEGWSAQRPRGESREDLPRLDDMMLFDALDGNIDASWDVFGG